MLESFDYGSFAYVQFFTFSLRVWTAGAQDLTRESGDDSNRDDVKSKQVD